MPEHFWSVLCYKGCLDQYTNQVSLLDVIDQVVVRPLGEQPPINTKAAMPIHLNIVSLWGRAEADKPERIQVRVVVVAPDGSEIRPGGHVDGDLETKWRLRTFMRFDSMPFRGAGHYRFAVEHRSNEGDEWRRVASLPLDLRIEPTPQSVRSKVSERGGRARSAKRRERTR